jgi:serine/threonine-protein kinase
MRFRRHQPRGSNWTGWLEPLTRRLRRLAALPKRGKLVVSLIGFVGAFVMGYIIAALVVFPAPILASNVPVPRLLGMERSAAIEALADVGLAVGDTQTTSHPEAERDAVVWQDPPAGMAVPPRTSVDVTVSGGPQRVPVPDLVGYDALLAGQLIAAAGLSVRSIDSTQAPVPRGVVVNTRPPAGSTLLPGNGVTLVVSVGAPTITVPNLAGLSEIEAQIILEQVNLVLGTSVRRTHQVAEPGTVLEQRPAAGTLAAPGTAVNITIARRRTP